MKITMPRTGIGALLRVCATCSAGWFLYNVNPIGTLRTMSYSGNAFRYWAELKWSADSQCIVAMPVCKRVWKARTYAETLLSANAY